MSDYWSITMKKMYDIVQTFEIHTTTVIYVTHNYLTFVLYILLPVLYENLHYSQTVTVH